MNVFFHKDFEKDYKKLKLQERERFETRMMTFRKDPHDPILNNHQLKGKYATYRSINITGDIRAIYKVLSSNDCIFFAIGTHSQLYK